VREREKQGGICTHTHPHKCTVSPSCSLSVLFQIPAKKWGDTEIAERGRSGLVMRARYRSAGLTPHQRGWTDAGWTVSQLQLCNGPL